MQNKVPESSRDKKAVFLDRDGLINKKRPEGDYVKDWNEFEFLVGAQDALRLLSQNNYEIYIVTNQRGIARGLMSEADLHRIHQEMVSELKRDGVEIKRIYYCPHNKNSCNCRKPKPGMLLKAAEEHNLELTETVLIGDSESDIQAGLVAGCRTIKVNEGDTLLTVVQKLIT